MKKQEIIAYLWGDDHYEDSLEEMIEYMISDEVGKEYIIGMKIELCEEANVYSDDDYVKIQDILYEGIGQCEGDYFEREVVEILKKIEYVKYYSPFKKYTITEEDYEEVIKYM